jgi:acetyl-CoA carboxylase carboxyl transferase subunit alpha
VPIVAAIVGEGGSGGAVALATAERVLMFEHAVYSVISPEGCASIMWRDATKKEIAAQALRITPNDLKELGIIDDIVAEPPGGAHNDHDAAAALLGAALKRHLSELASKPVNELLDSRYSKYRNLAQFFTESA